MEHQMREQPVSADLLCYFSKPRTSSVSSGPCPKLLLHGGVDLFTNASNCWWRLKRSQLHSLQPVLHLQLLLLMMWAAPPSVMPSSPSLSFSQRCINVEIWRFSHLKLIKLVCFLKSCFFFHVWDLKHLHERHVDVCSRCADVFKVTAAVQTHQTFF